MKFIVFAPVLLMLLSVCSVLAHAGAKSSGKKSVQESPFACNVGALSEPERKRHFDELGPMLRGMKREYRAMPDGYEFRFSSDRKTFDLVAEWAIQEHLCCPFFSINIRLDHEGGDVWLQLSGRKGTKEFIHDDFAGWMK